MNEISAKQIAQLIGGTVEGNENVTINKVAKIEEGSNKSISFLDNPAYVPYLYTTDASVVIISSNFVLEKPVKPTCTLIRVAEPRASFSILLEMYSKMKQMKEGIETPSSIAKTAKIGKSVYVGAFAYIGENATIGNNVKIYPHTYIADNCVIDDNTTIFSGVKVYHECKVGKNCIIHAGAIIGGDGFGFVPKNTNNYQKMPQIGNVVLEDDVEIGANTTIDRATLGSTIIKKGVKLDNLIQIGHNVEIGENTVIAAQTGIAGSTKIGKNCMIGGQVGIIGHLTIADGTKIAAQSGIGTSITCENDILQGSPAFKIGDYKRSYVIFRNLPKLDDDLKELKTKVLENKK